MTPYSSSACILRVSVSRGSSQRSGSGIGTWKTTIWPSASGVSGIRWRVWIRVAASVRVVVRTPVVRSKNRRMLTALVVSSAPWSITLSTSSGPITLAVTCTPPVPHPYEQRHLAAAERHLVAGDRHRLQDGPADHPLRLLVEVREVVAVHRAGPRASARERADQHQLGLEIDVMRQLQVLDEARGLDVVAVVEDELLVLRRRGRLSPSSRQRSARSTSAIVIALRSAWPNTSP